MEASIIIPTAFQRPEYFHVLLESLHEQKHIGSWEIIIVLSGGVPTVDLDSLVRLWSQKLEIKMTYTIKDGLHHARHLGANIAGGDLLIFIDDDVRIAPDWLSSYSQFFETTGALCAGGRVLPEWKKTPADWITLVTPDVFSLLDYGNEARELSDREGINGCNFAILKSALFQHGGFHPDGFSDEKMQWLRGDGEYGLVQKIKAGGNPVYYLPTACVYHRIPEKRCSLDAVEKTTKARAISSAYNFTRKSKNKFLAGSMLIFYGLSMSFLNSIMMVIRTDNTNKVLSKLLNRKYLTFAQYGFRLLRDKSLRQHVARQDYLEE